MTGRSIFAEAKVGLPLVMRPTIIKVNSAMFLAIENFTASEVERFEFLTSLNRGIYWVILYNITHY